MIQVMKLDLGTRSGIAGVVLALFSIAAFYIWPTKKWIGWVCLVLTVLLLLAWAVAEFRSRREPIPPPSFVFLFGVPLGDNAASVWMMVPRHYGPGSAHNCTLSFYDKDRKNIEHLWLVNHSSSPFLPPGQFDPSQAMLYVLEANPEGVILGHFQGSPLDPDRQHYEVSISCREGVFVEKWEVTRVHGVLRSRLVIERGSEWVRQNPHLDPIVFKCEDPEFVSTPLTTEVRHIPKKVVHPGWKPSYRVEPPMAIIDPNGNLQIASGIKQPDGSTMTDFGCWNLLTKHFGDAAP
jgi:hypothetical protein